MSKKLHSLPLSIRRIIQLGGRWPSRLEAAAEEDRLSIKRNLYTSFAAASDCRTIAIYECAA